MAATNTPRWLGTGWLGAWYGSTWFGPSGPPLLPTVTFTAVEIAPPSPASPWTIDPNRTQEIT